MTPLLPACGSFDSAPGPESWPWLGLLCLAFCPQSPALGLTFLHFLHLACTSTAPALVRSFWLLLGACRLLATTTVIIYEYLLLKLSQSTKITDKNIKLSSCNQSSSLDENCFVFVSASLDAMGTKLCCSLQQLLSVNEDVQNAIKRGKPTKIQFYYVHVFAQMEVSCHHDS